MVNFGQFWAIYTGWFSKSYESITFERKMVEPYIDMHSNGLGELYSGNYTSILSSSFFKVKSRFFKFNLALYRFTR